MRGSARSPRSAPRPSCAPIRKALMAQTSKASSSSPERGWRARAGLLLLVAAACSSAERRRGRHSRSARRVDRWTRPRVVHPVRRRGRSLGADRPPSGRDDRLWRCERRGQRQRGGRAQAPRRSGRRAGHRSGAGRRHADRHAALPAIRDVPHPGVVRVLRADGGGRQRRVRLLQRRQRRQRKRDRRQPRDRFPGAVRNADVHRSHVLE